MEVMPHFAEQLLHFVGESLDFAWELLQFVGESLKFMKKTLDFVDFFEI